MALNPYDSKQLTAGGHEVERRWATWMPIVAAIALTVVLPRLLVMQVSVIDWDESSYALVAQHWLDGHVPYSKVFDHKPIGLYAIFAAFFLAFGDSVFTIRLIALAFSVGTALLLARSAERQFGGKPWLGAWVAALYGLSSVANGGLATNTEILVNFFVALALWLLVGMRGAGRPSVARCLAIGASLGAAFQVNYLAGILAMGFAAYYLCWIANLRPVSLLLRRYLLDGAAMLAGFLGVWVLLLLPVMIAGDLRDYFSLQFTYLSDYASVTSSGTITRRVSEALLPWWPLCALALVLAGCQFASVRRALRIEDAAEAIRDRRLTSWLVLTAFGLLAASASGYFYHHFFLFALPGLVMAGAAFLALVTDSPRMRVLCAAWLLLMAGASVLGSHETLGRGMRAHRAALDGRPPDAVAAVGRYISGRLEPGETIFVFEQQPVLYFLTRTTPPSRLAFPNYYVFGFLAPRFGTTPGKLLTEALDARPRFIVAGPHRESHADLDAVHDFYARLGREYVPVSATDPGAPAIVHELARKP